MRASVVDLRHKMKEILQALARNEPVTITYHGTDRAVMLPLGRAEQDRKPFRDSPAFGMWKDRDEMKDVTAWLRAIRRGRIDDL